MRSLIHTSAHAAHAKARGAGGTAWPTRIAFCAACGTHTQRLLLALCAVAPPLAAGRGGKGSRRQAADEEDGAQAPEDQEEEEEELSLEPFEE